MSNQGSTDLLDLVDVGDLLDTLGDEVDAAVAAALVTSPSLDTVKNEQGVPLSKGETEAVPHGAGAVEVAGKREEPREEEHEEHQRQDDKAETEEEQEPRGRIQQPRRLEVDIDSTPLSVQHGYDRFRQLEKLREEQKKEMQMKEEVEKGKSAYMGKKWVVKQPAGPLRPQEAGQLKVASAVKAGVEKMSPREEIDKLTREQAEKKKKEKELAAAAAAGPSYMPTKPPLNSETATGEETAKEGGTAKEEGAAKEGGTAKEEDEAKEGEAAPMETTALKEDTAAEENKEGEAGATAAARTDQGGHRDEEKREGDNMEGKTLVAGNLEKRPTGLQENEPNTKPALTAAAHGPPQDKVPAHADAARKANASKPKKKIFQLFSCFSKKGGVTEPHKPPGKKRTSTAEHAEASSTGELSETFHAEHKGIRTAPPFTEPVFDD